MSFSNSVGSQIKRFVLHQHLLEHGKALKRKDAVTFQLLDVVKLTRKPSSLLSFFMSGMPKREFQQIS